MTKLAELKQRLMDNPEVRKEYAKADAEFALIEAKLTQAELAEKVGTPQVVTSGESSHKKTLITLRLFHFYV